MRFDGYCERYPRTIKATSCTEEWSGRTPCVRCDPMGTGTDRLEADDFVDPTDLYVCRSRPSLGEMLGQVVLDAPHVLSEAAGTVVEGAENIFGNIWNAAKRFGVWVIIVGVVLFSAALIWVRVNRPTDSDEAMLDEYEMRREGGMKTLVGSQTSTRDPGPRRE